jgi:prevent-host-death family protein
MDDGSKRVPITALLRSSSTVLARLAESDEPVIVTRRGRPAAVLLSARAWAEVERDRQVLRALALGEIEAAAGVGEDLDQVLSDAEALLEEN